MQYGQLSKCVGLFPTLHSQILHIFELVAVIFVDAREVVPDYVLRLFDRSLLESIVRWLSTRLAIYLSHEPPEGALDALHADTHGAEEHRLLVEVLRRLAPLKLLRGKLSQAWRINQFLVPLVVPVELALCLAQHKESLANPSLSIVRHGLVLPAKLSYLVVKCLSLFVADVATRYELLCQVQLDALSFDARMLLVEAEEGAEVRPKTTLLAPQLVHTVDAVQSDHEHGQPRLAEHGGVEPVVLR